eukprot:COSAG04_NODE_33778_length_130_cov_202.451613_1_plen_26_part_01
MREQSVSERRDVHGVDCGEYGVFPCV